MDTKIYSGIGRTVGVAVLVVLVLVGIAFLSHPVTPQNPQPGSQTGSETQLSATSSVANISPENLPGIQTTPAPWIAELDHLHDRLDAIGLPALSAEGTALHIHQHIDIFIHGASISVPAGIGIYGVNASSGFISPIHVHDDTGIIHVESPTIQTFTLGQFFDIWGVRFTNQCIGSYCTDQSGSLKVYVNGQLYQGDPRQIALAAHQEIAVVYGTAPENPPTIPSTYTFPDGD